MVATHTTYSSQITRHRALRLLFDSRPSYNSTCMTSPLTSRLSDGRIKEKTYKQVPVRSNIIMRAQIVAHVSKSKFKPLLSATVGQQHPLDLLRVAGLALDFRRDRDRPGHGPVRLVGHRDSRAEGQPRTK